MSNYLKKFLFTLLIIAVPYMNSALKAMDEEYEGSTVIVHQVSFESEDQQDVQAFTKQSASSQVVSLENSQDSWASSLLYPAKYVVQSAYDVMNFTTQNPRKAIMVGAILLYQVTAVAALNCTGCYRCNCNCQGTYGPANGVLECAQACKLANLQYYGCLPYKS